jgi:hypothetical protein
MEPFLMTTREKIGLGILISLFVAGCIVLIMTFKSWGGRHAPEDSIFVQQRMINLRK